MGDSMISLGCTLWRKQVPAWARYAAYLLAAYYARELYLSMSERDLNGLVVLITGGGSGIGRLLAKKLAKMGCKVIIWDLVESAASEAAADITMAGGIARAYAVDITDKELVATVARQCVVDMGADVDILINNAGIVHGKSLLEASDAAIEKTFQVNAIAHCWLLRAFLPAMIRRDSGTVMTVASASAYVGVAKLGDYAASKWAAMGLAESLRMELKRMGSKVRSLTVSPYYINTGMFDGVKTRFPLILPILEPEYVAATMLRALKRNEEVVCMPYLVSLVPLMRALLPTSWFDAITFALGINNTMDDFRGRTAAAADAANASSGH